MLLSYSPDDCVAFTDDYVADSAEPQFDCKAEQQFLHPANNLSDKMVWDETPEPRPGLPKVTVVPKHDESRHMLGVEWVCCPPFSRPCRPTCDMTAPAVVSATSL